jgi:hypothetical protein
MDKQYKDDEKNGSYMTKIEGGGILTILLTLSLIASSFFFLNLSLTLSEKEERGAGALDDAVIAFCEKIEENEAVSAFLGLDYYDEKEIY